MSDRREELRVLHEALIDAQDDHNVLLAQLRAGASPTWGASVWLGAVTAIVLERVPELRGLDAA